MIGSRQRHLVQTAHPSFSQCSATKQTPFHVAILHLLVSFYLVSRKLHDGLSSMVPTVDDQKDGSVQSLWKATLLTGNALLSQWEQMYGWLFDCKFKTHFLACRYGLLPNRENARLQALFPIPA